MTSKMTPATLAHFVHRSRVQRVYRAYLMCCLDDDERRRVRAEFDASRGASLEMGRKVLKRAEADLVGIANQRAPRRLLAKTLPDVANSEPVRWPWEHRSS